MKVIFLGNSEFSVSVLKDLLESHHKVLCAFGSPDKESGRGHKINFSPLKKFCMERGLDFFSTKSISKEGFETLSKYAPDVLITASFGQILRENVLNFAPYGVVNVHTSLLPKYRGSCPVNMAIMNGEKKTGITIMKTAKALDSGDIILQEEIDIKDDETAGELLDRLSIISGKVLIKALDKMESGEATYTKQDESEATYYPMLNKDMAKIDFDKSAKEIVCFCNALNPWPVSYVQNENIFLKVYKAKIAENKWGIDQNIFSNGEVVLSSAKSGLIVKCQDGLVLLDVIQAPNGKVMMSSAYLNGKPIPPKTKF